jgi:single-stranded DNA-binding protein
MTRRSPAYYLWFLLSVSGCSCEFHAGTSHRTGTSSGGERTAADIERDRLRQEEWERERQARHQREIEQQRQRPHVSGPPPAPTHVTGQPAPAAGPRHAPPLPAGSTGSTPATSAPATSVSAQPTPAPAPTPVVPTPVVVQPPATVAQPAPAAPPAPPPAPPPNTEPPPAPPSDNFVQARDPSTRPDTTGQRPGTAGAPASPNQPRRVPRGTLAPK